MNTWAPDLHSCRVPLQRSNYLSLTTVNLQKSLLYWGPHSHWFLGLIHMAISPQQWDGAENPQPLDLAQ